MHAAACMPGPVELQGQGGLVAYVPLFWQIGQKEIRNKWTSYYKIYPPTNSLTFRRSYNHTTHTSMSCMKRRGAAAAVLAMLLHPLDEYVEKMPERIMICMESVLLYLLVSPHTTKARSQLGQILSEGTVQFSCTFISFHETFLQFLYVCRMNFSLILCENVG